MYGRMNLQKVLGADVIRPQLSSKTKPDVINELLGILVAVLGFGILPALGPFFWGGVAVAFLVLLGLIQSTLQSIFQAALYLYAKDGQIGEGFSREVLVGAMRERSS